MRVFVMGRRVHRPVTSRLTSGIEELVLHHHPTNNVDDIVEELHSRYSEYRRCKFSDLRKCVNSTIQKIERKQAVAVADDAQSKDEGCSLLSNPPPPQRKRRKLHSMSTTGESNDPKPMKEEEEEMTKALRGEDLMLEKDLQLNVVDCGIKEVRGGSYECGGGGGSNLISGEELEVKKEGPLLRDFGGIGQILEFLINEVIFPLCNLQLHQYMPSTPLKGILFHGSPGCGKTRLAHAIANEAGVPLYSISGSDVVSGVSGESEQNIRDLFTKAYKTAPSIIFIDEIDAIASKRENLQREMEKRIVTQLLTCMDESYQSIGRISQVSGSNSSPRRSSHVFVIGATNRLDALDAALRRPGRFDREIYLDVPDEIARHDILSAIIGDLRIEESLDLKRIAKMTPGFVGADLVAVVNKAASLAIGRRINTRKLAFTSGLYKTEGEKWRILWEPNEFKGLCAAMADFEEAILVVQPSLMREGFSPIPDVTWSDVGGVQSIRRYIEHSELY